MDCHIPYHCPCVRSSTYDWTAAISGASTAISLHINSVFISGQGCLGKTNKSGLVKRLGVVEISPKSADTVIVVFDKSFETTKEIDGQVKLSMTLRSHSSA